MLFICSEASAVMDQQMQQRQGMVATSIKCLKVAQQDQGVFGGGGCDEGSARAALWWTRLPLGTDELALPHPAGSPCVQHGLTLRTQRSHKTREVQIAQAPTGTSRSATAPHYPSTTPHIDSISSLVPVCPLPLHISSRRPVFPCILHSLSTYSSR